MAYCSSSLNFSETASRQEFMEGLERENIKKKTEEFEGILTLKDEL